MTPEQRQQAAIAEYNQFIADLQERYGVLVLPFKLTKDYGNGMKAPEQYGVDIHPIPDWRPPAAPEPKKK